MSDNPLEESSVPEDKGFLTDDPAPSGHKWEVVFQDNGDIVEWKPATGSKRDGTWIPGTIMEGVYVGASMVELKPEQLDSTRPERTHAPLLTFEDEDMEERWSTWETYQILAERFIEGETYKIACLKERKTEKGHMKSFRIERLHRAS